MVYDLHDNNFYIISGDLLKELPKKSDDGFWKMHGTSKYDHKNFLNRSQQYFQDLMDGKTSLADSRYFISAPMEYLDVGIASHIIVPCDMIHAENAHSVYVKHPVHVIEDGDGFRYVGDDGRHRYITAQENNLNLLVQVRRI